MDEPTQSASEEQLSRLRHELSELTSDAFKRGARCEFWAVAWQVTDLLLGVSTAVLAAIAGATGLASTAGRIPAAIMALTAAALGAATRFLHSSERYDKKLEKPQRLATPRA